jgi:hypothetical protein
VQALGLACRVGSRRRGSRSGPRAGRTFGHSGVYSTRWEAPVTRFITLGFELAGGCQGSYP